MSEKVELHIEGERFVFWQTVDIERSIDAVNGIKFTAPFDWENEWFRKKFRPFSYLPVLITVNDATLFTGTMVDVDPRLDTSKTISISAYSTCGVLMDCTAPDEAHPLEFNNLNLKSIAENLAAYFKVGVVFKDDPGATFSRVACDPDKKVFEFLADLAKQRGFVISSDEEGNLLFWKSAQGEPVAILEQGASPLSSVTPSFDPQNFYSDLTGMAPVEVAKPAVKVKIKTKKEKKKPGDLPLKKGRKPKPAKKYSKFSVENEDATVFRPLVFKIDDADGPDVQTATKAKLGRMLGNMAKYSIQVSTWRDVNGNLWAPNTRIKLFAPDAMIYTPYTFEIKSVSLKKDRNSETATLELVLPGSFSGEPPETFPWEM